MAPVDAVVCARDEEATVGKVVRVLRRSPRIGQVIVVDDGSQDWTARRARRAGALVVSGPENGKAAAMREGLRYVQTPRVLFADADTRGLTLRHVRGLTRDNGGQVAGLRDNGSRLLGPLPPVTGERCVPVWLASQALATAHGYEAETAINAAIGDYGLPASTFRMIGVRNPRRAPLARTGQVLRASARHLLGVVRYMAAWLVTAAAAALHR